MKTEIQPQPVKGQQMSETREASVDDLIYASGEVPGMNEEVRQSVQSALELLLYGEGDVDLRPTIIALLKDALSKAFPDQSRDRGS